MALTALGYFGSILCLSIYSTRELVMDPVLFRSLSSANHLLTGIWCYSLLLMFAYYPSRIANTKVIIAAYAIVVIVWLNQTLQWYEVPVHAY